jgi:sugar lactone lactonase YvrE
MKKLILTLFIYIITITPGNSQSFDLIAGTGTSGYSGDGGDAINSELNFPRHLVFDVAGNLYFADQGNHVIRKIDVNGIISTIAGNGSLGYSGDNLQANSAQLDNPRGVCIDVDGNILIADSGNHVIRKIDVNGIITTIAGNGYSGFSGDNGLATSAQLNSPKGIHTDNLGNIYIPDTSNHRVRKIDTNGIISTIAGNGSNGYSGDGGLATNAGFETPYDVITKDNTIYIADMGDGSIRKINSSGIVSTIINDDGTHIIGIPSAINFDNNDNLFISDLSGKIFKIDTSENTTLVFDNEIGAAGGFGFDINFNLYYSETGANQIRKIDNALLKTNDWSLVNKLKIFPNPTQEYINIDISDFPEFENVYLYDSNGKLIQIKNDENFKIKNNNNSVKIKLNSPGIYFLKVKSKKGVITKKIIKY